MPGTKSRVSVRILTEADVTADIVDQINALVKKQHGTAYQNDESYVRDFLRHSVLVIAVQNGKVVGLITYVKTHCLTHVRGSIHNFITGKDQDPIGVGRKLLTKLMETIPAPPSVIAFDAQLQDPHMEQLFVELGFKKREHPQFRRIFKR